MLTLFETTDPVLPAIDGLTYIPDFLTYEEHDRFLAHIDAGEWDTRWKRRTQVYGGSYDSSPEMSSVQRMPAWGTALAERLYTRDLTPILCNTMLINEYLPGQGIASHVDYHPYDRTVVSISLGSPCLMDFEHVDGHEKHQIWLEPRSALIMDGEARYQWKHGIAARKSDTWNGVAFKRGRRVSITFRKKRNSQYVSLVRPRLSDDRQLMQRKSVLLPVL